MGKIREEMHGLGTLVSGSNWHRHASATRSSCVRSQSCAADSGIELLLESAVRSLLLLLSLPLPVPSLSALLCSALLCAHTCPLAVPASLCSVSSASARSLLSLTLGSPLLSVLVVPQGKLSSPNDTPRCGLSLRIEKPFRKSSALSSPKVSTFTGPK